MNKVSSKQRRKTPAWRISWLGIGLAMLLWFGSSVYFQKTYQFTEIEHQTGNISRADFEDLVLRYTRYSIACKVGAGVLLLGSLLHLFSQIDIRQRRHPADGDN